MLNALYIGSQEETHQAIAVILASLNMGCDHEASVTSARNFLKSFGHTVHIILIDLTRTSFIEEDLLALKKLIGDSTPILALGNAEQTNISIASQMLELPVNETKLRHHIDQAFSQTETVEGSMKSPRKRRVLVVDDDQMMRDIICRNLIKAEYDACAAMDGLQGIAEVDRLNPDIILLDINMPLMNGYEVVEELKNSVRTRSIPIIAISGDRAEKKAIAAGVDFFCRKPVEMKKLVELVDRALNDEGAA